MTPNKQTQEERVRRLSEIVWEQALATWRLGVDSGSDPRYAIEDALTSYGTERYNEALEKAINAVKGSPWVQNGYYIDTLEALKEKTE